MFKAIVAHDPNRVIGNNLDIPWHIREEGIYSLEKGKIGNLVILVGANNSGKSNLLAALKSFKEEKITERDLTTLSYDEVYQKPTLSLCSKDGDKEFYYRIGYQTSPSYGYPKNLHLDFNYVENLNLFKHLINELIDSIGYGYSNGKFMQLFI